MISEDPITRKFEAEKLERRVSRFISAVVNPVHFIYCYPVTPKTSDKKALQELCLTDPNFLETFPRSKISLYFSIDIPSERVETDNFLIPPEFSGIRNFFAFKYHRDARIHRIWGGDPFEANDLFSPNF